MRVLVIVGHILSFLRDRKRWIVLGSRGAED
jgi:hypothetical protein